MSLTEFEQKLLFGKLVPLERGDYDANGNLIYQGYYPPGTATSGSAGGLIKKYTWDASNRWTATQRALGVAWDNRTTATYT